MGNTINKYFKVEGMHCSACERTIFNAIKGMDGVFEARIDHKTGSVFASFDEDKQSGSSIAGLIGGAGYKVVETGNAPIVHSADWKKEIIRLFGILTAVAAAYMLINVTVGFNFIPEFTPGMGLGIIFAAGLLTSIHCMAMCGGINISQCAGISKSDGGFSAKGKGIKNYPDTVIPGKEEEFSKSNGFRRSMLYNAGRVMSYTAIGGIIGGIGAVFTFSPILKTAVMLAAGSLMIVMGLKMSGAFSILNGFILPVPRFINIIADKSRGMGPFAVGLLNGFMPCGPLQAMQLYALGSGSAFNGALAMFIFGLGTVPLMFGIGTLASLLTGKFSKLLVKTSAVIVIILGVIMAGRGLALSGKGIASNVMNDYPENAAVMKDGYQEVVSFVTNDGYQPITVQKGIKVRWIIKTTSYDLNGCNNPLTVPDFNITKKLVPGENVIEFFPEKSGKIIYTCWMGMISNTISVVEDI